jgi:hypothetical protein
VSDPIAFERRWFEDEETAPGGGRIRYVVEVEVPDEQIGEECYRTIVNEEAVLDSGAVTGRDSMLLSEEDLVRMIDALMHAHAAIGEHKKAKARAAAGGHRA